MKSLISKLKQPGELLNHILDMPELPAIVQNLDAGVLTKLIRHIGLEDSSQIISLATTDQLEGVLDEDLWHCETPGRDETFDAERFSLWLEIMMENGSAFAARKVTELDEDLVTLGLCRLVLVVGFHDIAPRIGDEKRPGNDDILEKVLDGSLNQEFGNRLVIAKNESSWDTVCDLLAELNELDYDMLIRLLDRCCRISEEYIEDNGGLYHVLTANEMLEEDVSSERKERREAKGFVTPTSAAIFLSQARATPLNEMIAAKTLDPITRTYFRAVETKTNPAAGPQAPDKKSGKGASESIDLKVISFIQTLRNAEVLPASEYKLLGYNGADSWDHTVPLTEAMRFINKKDSDLYSQRLRELSYLANTLISGCGFKGRAFKPKEAAEAAFSVCNLGAEYLLKTDPGKEEEPPMDPLTALLKSRHLVGLFQVGWKILSDDVVFFTAKAVLEFILRQKDETTEPEQAYELTHTVKMLNRSISSGRPWECRDQIDYLQIFLDAETAMTLGELLQEMPTLSKALFKNERHRLSPFICSQSHIWTIRRFLRNEL
jgi:hypothetical protein